MNPDELPPDLAAYLQAHPGERRIGLCTIIAVKDLQIITYAFLTYELAVTQALANLQGVRGRVDRFPERRLPNGTREVVFRLPGHQEVIVAQEVALGEAVLPSRPGAMPTITNVPWPRGAA